MNTLSDIISSKTDDFFSTPTEHTNPHTTNNSIVNDNFSNDDILNNLYPTQVSKSDKGLQTTDQSKLTNDEQTVVSSPLTVYHSPSEADIKYLKSMVHTMKDQLNSMIRLLEGEQVKQHAIPSKVASTELPTGEQLIEGVFNGEKMIGSDGHEYSVPPNYASKSKLVEGDMMKLIITKQGRFIYKSIGPIERKRLKGELVSDSVSGQWSVLSNGKTYKILTASVTFWKGYAGDEVIFFVPSSGESAWGAVENIINK